MQERKIIPAAPGLWVLEEVGVNLFLIAGERRAVLVDSGFGGNAELRREAEELCGLPVELVHTHGHGDHTGGDALWEEVWLHPGDWPEYRRMRGETTCLRPLEDGMVFDLGGRKLEVLHIPGHTPGSVALLDRKHRLLFSGDTVMTQPVFLMPPNGCPKEFRESLGRLKGLSGEFDTIYPCHQRWPLAPEPALSALTDCARRAELEDEDTLTEFSIDLVMVVERFKGYVKDGYGVAVAGIK